MRDDEMDRELAEEFRASRAEFREGMARLEGKMDAMQGTLHNHAVDDARLFQKVGDSAATAHKRLDNHLEDHARTEQGKFSLWIGVGLAFLSSLLAWIFSLLKGGKP